MLLSRNFCGTIASGVHVLSSCVVSYAGTFVAVCTDGHTVVFVLVSADSAVAWWLGVGVLVVVLGAVGLTVVARVKVVVDVGLRIGSTATAREAFEEDHVLLLRGRGRAAGRGENVF